MTGQVVCGRDATVRPRKEGLEVLGCSGRSKKSAEKAPGWWSDPALDRQTHQNTTHIRRHSVAGMAGTKSLF